MYYRVSLPRNCSPVVTDVKSPLCNYNKDVASELLQGCICLPFISATQRGTKHRNITKISFE